MARTISPLADWDGMTGWWHSVSGWFAKWEVFVMKQTTARKKRKTTGSLKIWQREGYTTLSDVKVGKRSCHMTQLGGEIFAQSSRHRRPSVRYLWISKGHFALWFWCRLVQFLLWRWVLGGHFTFTGQDPRSFSIENSWYHNFPWTRQGRGSVQPLPVIRSLSHRIRHVLNNLWTLYFILSI